MQKDISTPTASPMSVTLQSGDSVELVAINKLAWNETSISGFEYHDRLASELYQHCPSEFREFLLKNPEQLPNCVKRLKARFTFFPEDKMGLAMVELVSHGYDGWSNAVLPLSADFTKHDFVIMVKKRSFVQ